VEAACYIIGRDVFEAVLDGISAASAMSIGIS
jgi:hypothetical protein